MLFDQLLRNINEHILNPLIFLFLGAATVVFLFGVVKYIQGYDSDEARTEGKQHMFWGVVGMFIMVSVFGIMYLIANTIGVDVPALGN